MQQQTILILILVHSFILSLVVRPTSAFQWNNSLSQVLHPTQECLRNPPVNIFYYSFLFTVDSPLQDYCLMNFSFECSSLCENSIPAQDIKSTANLESMTGLINYCLYCNSSESLEFRKKLVEGKCDSFTISGESSGKENVGPKLYEMMEYHCGENNMPLIDMTFMNSDYFRRNIYNSKNTTLDWQTIISLFFSKYVSLTQYSNHPLEIPVICWCSYQDAENSHPTFSHQCFDVNSNFLEYSYRTSPLILTIVFFLLFILHFIFLVIPKFTERIIKLKKALSFDHEFKPTSFKITYTILHFIHISVHPPVLFSITLFLPFIENLVRVLSNYSFFYSYYMKFFVGIFRGLGGICGLCGYSSLVILWSHSIDLANTKKEQPKFLSRINMSILGLVYIGVAITLITLFALFLAIDQNSAYIVVSVSALIYTLSFVLGFIIYGFKMIHKLRASNIWEYKFTKFIVSLSILSTIVWILSILIFITYSLGFDIFGTFFGNARNIILDLCIIAMTTLSSYITINEEGFKKLYGEKMYLFFTFSCFSLVRSKKNVKIPTNVAEKSNNSLGKNRNDETSISVSESQELESKEVDRV